MRPVLRLITFDVTTIRSNKVDHSFNYTFFRHSNVYLSYLLTSDTAAFELAKQKNFALDIPDEDQCSEAKFRIVKKSFAIACQTTMSSENQFMKSTKAE